MDDLVHFLRTCLDEERAAAETALKRTTTTRRMIGGEMVEDTIQPPEWRRSAWSPQRVLAELDAKLRVLELHTPIDDRYSLTQLVCRICNDGGLPVEPASWPCLTLRLLALPHADHPAYREDWRPRPTGT